MEVRKTVADHLVGHIALAFELVYLESRRMTIDQGYFQKLLETEFENPRTRETMKKIKDTLMKTQVKYWGSHSAFYE